MKKAETEKEFARKWVTYRPEIKVVDVTIRDGGLMNNHQFSDDVVRAVYRACVEAGVDYMELGYRASKRISRRTNSARGSSATRRTSAASWVTTRPR
jgi:isopropylmalate/homocitrate/citramalate synthase